MRRKDVAGQVVFEKFKINHDIISEQEFTFYGHNASADPRWDSPGDSELDAGTEFSMGMYYQPTETDFIDDEEEELRKNEITLLSSLF